MSNVIPFRRCRGPESTAAPPTRQTGSPLLSGRGGEPTDDEIRDEIDRRAIAILHQTPIDLYDWRTEEFDTSESLADDWRSFVRCVRAEPVSHALVAIAAIVFWTLLLIAPLLIGELS